MQRDPVTVINRTSKQLQVIWDGRVRNIPVGKSTHEWIVAQKAKEQNVLMGSQDPRTGDIVYLVAIEEAGEDASPVEQNPNPRERWNRSYMPGGNEGVQVIQGRSGYLSGVQTAQPTMGSFEANPASAQIPPIPRI